MNRGLARKLHLVASKVNNLCRTKTGNVQFVACLEFSNLAASGVSRSKNQNDLCATHFHRESVSNSLTESKGVRDGAICFHHLDGLQSDGLSGDGNKSKGRNHGLILFTANFRPPMNQEICFR